MSRRADLRAASAVDGGDPREATGAAGPCAGQPVRARGSPGIFSSWCVAGACSVLCAVRNAKELWSVQAATGRDYVGACAVYGVRGVRAPQHRRLSDDGLLENREANCLPAVQPRVGSRHEHGADKQQEKQCDGGEKPQAKAK